jgi:xanthine dehydrogenase molybdenum-binding subunit
MVVGESIARVDGYDKVTGRAKYTDDLIDKALIIKIVHSTIAHGMVTKIDTSEAEKVEGVIRVVTCFDGPDIQFPTAGHPWAADPKSHDVADRHLLNKHVRYFGDEVAAVVAENEIAAERGVRAVKVEYEIFEFAMNVEEAMRDGAAVIHGEYPQNILGHTSLRLGDYQETIKDTELIKVEGWYETPTVHHCHLENFICCSYMENNRLTVVTSTQIPHIVRRIVGQALGISWGKIRIIKPYIGGGFGNKQDALYEPLCAYICTLVGGRKVKLDVSREESFVNNRVRHAIKTHIISYVRKDGTFAARKMEAFSDQGAYASHGHAIVNKGQGAFPQMYPCTNIEADSYTVYTNKPAAGAMRGYGMPQAMFAVEAHTDDVARALGMNPVEFRMKNIMPKDYRDKISNNQNYFDSFRQCIEKGKEIIEYDEKFIKYQSQKGFIKRGIGMAAFWYNTGVWPFHLESSSCRMVLNQDGSIQLQIGETEIGQGADTAFAQMAAETVGLNVNMVHVISTQDTDVAPYGSGAYASRQTYIGGFSIQQTGLILKEKILDYAQKLKEIPVSDLDIIDGNIIRIYDNKIIMSVGELAFEALYSRTNSHHITAESTYQAKSNAYSFGCSFAEVEVDIKLCKIKLLRMVNVHDAGRLVNPELAKAQVHGGMSMAIGYALSEKIIFNSSSGKALNNNLLDYKLATFMDHPELEAHFIENYEPTSAFGTKALGEPPAISGAPAIRNAVYQATGIAFNEIPMTPQVLYREFKEKGLMK